MSGDRQGRAGDNHFGNETAGGGINDMQQLEIEVLYNLRCETAASMFDLREVMTYTAKPVGLIPGRVWFGAGNTFSKKLTAHQRRNFLRFLNRHELKRFLVLDDFHKKQPNRAPMDDLGRVAGPDVESAVSAPGCA